MHRRDFYFKQPVAEDELDDAFAQAELAMRNLASDQELRGIYSGGTVAEHVAVPNLTVDVAGPCKAYDNDGQRIFFAGPVVVVNCAQDSDAIATTVAGVGNEKWVSITLKFKRTLSDPRVDGNSATVYFVRNESYELVVTQGTEASLGTATRPPLDPDGLLLVDVKRTYGQTQIFNANISTSRREDTIVLEGPPGGLSLRAGTIAAGIEAMLGNLNDHILGTAGAHVATAVDYEGSAGTWRDGEDTPTGNLEEVLDELFATLVDDAADVKIGAPARAGAKFALVAGSVGTQTAALLAALNTIAAYRRIGLYSGGVAPVDLGATISWTTTNTIVVPNVVAGDKLVIDAAVIFVSTTTGEIDGFASIVIDAVELARAEAKPTPRSSGTEIMSYATPLKAVYTHAGATGSVTILVQGIDNDGNHLTSSARQYLVEHVRP